VLTDDEQTAHRERHTCDDEPPDQRCEPVERRRRTVDPDDDRRDSVATRVNRVRDEAAIGSDEAVITIVGSRCRRRGANIGAVRQETAIRSPDPAVCRRADACAHEDEEHAEDERNSEHFELLLLGPLGAADEETVLRSRRNAGNVGCNVAAKTAESPAK
jgi:hypothetical protein